ncbi:MAG: S8 family serine peptidase, partial [Bacilli bacterium]|nr:S8 family serine peptidase [Bacilli bacterium]
MKNKVKVILFLIITLFLFSLATNEVFASENINYEPKIYCELNVEDDFSLDSVLVMIDKNLSDVNKVFEKSFFGNLDIINIEDLTYRENWNNNVDIKEENFRQTLELHLESQTKDSIISIIKNLEKIDGIVCASPNYIGTNGLVTISDENYYLQWGLSNTNGINAEQAWDFVIGSREVRVGILDTGITPHVDLNDNLISGFSYIGDNTNDYKDHGSHVAGIVGAVGNTLGISGVARKISLVPMKFKGDIGDIQSALTDAEANNIRIVNMSWWDFPNNPILRNAINTFDGLFVCIAGNGDTDIETKPNYPASFNLDNMIVVGAIKSDSSRPTVSDWGYDKIGKPIGSNYGSNTVDLFAPGDNIYSTVPTNSYASMGGTSMAAPHVAGVAALLLSINPNLTTQQLRTAILESVDIPNVNGSNPLEDLCVTDGRLNAYNAVRYVLENYMNPTTYTLSNYSSTINTNKTIASDASYFDELNGFYKLNVTYAKSYEFISSSASGIEVTLYDEDFTEIPFNDLDSTSNKVHFIENLNTGTYYLRTKYSNEENTGTINTEISSRTPTYISEGDNDVLLNTYNGIYEYIYTNNQGPGIYRFKLNGTIIGETSIIYPSNSLVLYTDYTRNIEVDKLYYAENEMLVYLPSNGTYYLNINLNEASYSSLSINISSIEKNTIDYINGLTSIRFNIIFENENSLYYYEEVTIKQKSEIQLDIMTSGTITDSIPVYVYSRIFNEETNKYDLVETFIGEITPIDRVPVYTLVLDAGTYYFGYKNNIDNTNINFGIRRMVDYDMNMEGILVADPDETGFELGTEVLINKGECNKYYITEGFTRNIYLLAEDKFSIPISRLDYDWYSSDESVATVTNYGTVLAMPVTINTEVTIYAVLKADPKIVYYRTFTVLNDEEENLEEIILNMSYSYSDSNGTYQLELNNTNCPYPMIQYYSWNIRNESEETVTMNQW